MNCTHNWTANGTYAIRVKAKDCNGAVSNWSKVLNITINQSKEKNIEKPVITIWTPQNSFTQQNIIFTVTLDNYQGSTDQLRYEWDFGDDTKETGMRPNHTYISPGTYTITVTVYNGNELLTSTTVKLVVSAEQNVQSLQKDNNSLENIVPLWIIIIGGGIILLVIILWMKKSILSFIKKP